MKINLITIPEYMFILATIILIAVVPFIEYLSSKTGDELFEIEEELGRYNFNANHHSNQIVKLMSTKGDYLILDALNSTHKKELYEHLRAQWAQAIRMMNGGPVNLQELSKLSLEELEKESSRVTKVAVEEQNEFVKQKRDLESKLRHLKFVMRLFYLIAVILQLGVIVLKK